MKHHKPMIYGIIITAILVVVLVPQEGITETPIFKEYQVVEVQPFEIPLNVAAPESAGREIADEIVYQIRRYSAKFNLFELVIMEGRHELPPRKKVLLVTGTVTAYSPKGTCTVNCQFVDKTNGQVLHEAPAKGLTFRVANYIARVIYNYKVGEK